MTLAQIWGLDAGTALTGARNRLMIEGLGELLVTNVNEARIRSPNGGSTSPISQDRYDSVMLRPAVSKPTTVNSHRKQNRRERESSDGGSRIVD